MSQQYRTTDYQQFYILHDWRSNDRAQPRRSLASAGACCYVFHSPGKGLPKIEKRYPEERYTNEQPNHLIKNGSRAIKVKSPLYRYFYVTGSVIRR
jgi:hypothetical protein